VSSLLQPSAELPQHGLVDHLVEAAVGNEEDLELVVKSQRLQVAGNGEVWLAPAGGRPRPGYDYLAKLNRVYSDVPVPTSDRPPRSFGTRLAAAVEACERQVTERSRRLDETLLDCRAGIHDIAAVALTQLGELNLLFATDTEYSWDGYRELFRAWARTPQRAREIRQRLRMVAALVPTGFEAAYLESFRDHAQACFAETLCDDVPADVVADPNAYNPAPEDEDAPRYPLRVLFSRELVGMDPARNPDWHRSDMVMGAYRSFVEDAIRLRASEREDGARRSSLHRSIVS
jgi:hypothetical protein